MPEHEVLSSFPLPLSSYVDPGGSLLAVLSSRIAADPFNLVASAVFLVAILHTFLTARFATLAHSVQHHHDERAKAHGRTPTPSVLAELLHLLGEVEIVFGLWAAVLLVVLTVGKGWEAARSYLTDGIEYTEPMFVVVIMTLAATRPIVSFAETVLRRVADVGGGSPAAWWVTILVIGPLLGSFITEPATMTICSLLLAHQFYRFQPGARLKYATLGLLFVNVSIGGTLTHFAAPPVLMVARPWGWDTAYMLSHFGWRAVLSILLSTATYFLVFRRELAVLGERPAGAPDTPGVVGGGALPVPAWVTAAHAMFIAWTVFTAHYPALFVGGFLFFLGFARTTTVYQSRIDLRAPLLVGFFLGGLKVHGGLQGWWIAPVLSGLSEEPLFISAAVLTAFNDNALITYLATLVPALSVTLKAAVVEGAVTGGGLTVIANAPNPAGQALLGRFFGGSVSPAALFAGALLPTLITSFVFRVIP
jgi:Putative Na+/H+ antiporter